MGPTLEETRRDLRYMPTQYLTQVAQSPVDRVIGDIPLKTLAGLELSRRAQMQNELAAMGAANPQMPTVLDSTVQALSPQPQQPMPQQGMMPPQQPQQPMPQQGMPPPQPQPQQAAPQQPQPQQQQQPPQAKPNPIMGLPAMQAPKKMAGGGIIAFAGGDSVPPAEEATSTVGDAFRKALQWFQTVGDPSKNPREIEARAIERANTIRPGPLEAVTPSERTRRENESARILSEIAAKNASPAKQEVAQAEGSKQPQLPIQNVPNPDNGLAALMQAMGGMGGGRGGGGGGDGGLSAAAKRLAEFSEKETPEQQAYKASALRRAADFENYRAPSLSEAQRDALEEKQYSKYQARSKPHFDMMQKLIDEERASNEAGKGSEVYKMLGKMGGTLMSSRGAFGPALGRAVGEGIDYNDKVDAARVAAERLRRQAQMDLLKARMADEKGDQKSAQDYINEHDRNMRDAARLELDAKKASTEMLKGVADSDTKRQIEGARLGNALEIAGMRNAHSAQMAGANQQMGLMRLAMQMQGQNLKNLPTYAERIAIDKRAEEVFSDPRNPVVSKFVSMTPGGKNILDSIQMGTIKPNDPKYMQAVQSAQELYKKYLSQGTRTGGSGVQSGADYLSSIGG
jgi:hypothetical protein